MQGAAAALLLGELALPLGLRRWWRQWCWWRPLQWRPQFLPLLMLLMLLLRLHWLQVWPWPQHRQPHCLRLHTLLLLLPLLPRQRRRALCCVPACRRAVQACR